MRTEKLSPRSRFSSPRVAAQLVAQMQRRVAGPLGVVLVGDGRAEERHDAVAGVLVDRALEAVDAVGQDLEEAVEDPVPLLGVDLLGQLHRALHVGEEHGDLLALALEGGLALEDLVGEVLGGVVAGGAVRRRRRCGARRAAAPQPSQNLRPGGSRALAARTATARASGGAALSAEARVLRVLECRRPGSSQPQLLRQPLRVPRGAHLGVEAVGLAELALAGGVVAAQAGELCALLVDLRHEDPRPGLLDQLQRAVQRRFDLPLGGESVRAAQDARQGEPNRGVAHALPIGDRDGLGGRLASPRGIPQAGARLRQVSRAPTSPARGSPAAMASACSSALRASSSCPLSRCAQPQGLVGAGQTDRAHPRVPRISTDWRAWARAPEGEPLKPSRYVQKEWITLAKTRSPRSIVSSSARSSVARASPNRPEKASAHPRYDSNL